jgi:hypothetical protein
VQEITVDGDVVFSAGAPAGKHFYYIPAFNAAPEIEYYNLSTPFDVVNRGSPTDTFAPEPNGGFSYDATTAIAIRNDGTQILTCDRDYKYVCFDLSTPFDTTNATVAYQGDDLPKNTFGASIGTAGDDIFYLNTNTDELTQFNLSTPFDIRTRSSAGTHTFNISVDNIGSPAFSPDGTLMTVGTRGNNQILQSTCSTPFDITTYDDANENSYTTTDDDPLTVRWNGDGTKFFVRHLSPEMLDRYSVSTPYTLTGVSFETRIDTGANNGTIEFNYNY